MYQRLLWGIVSCGLTAAFAYEALTSNFRSEQLQAARSGLVLDARTRKPLADAYVVTRWLQQDTPAWGLGEVHGQCLHRVIVRTDAQGHFLIPDTHADFTLPRSWSPARNRAYVRELHVYAPEHIDIPGRLSADDPEVDSTLLVNADTGSPREHVGALRKTLADFACTARFSEPLPIAERVYAEAYAAACLPEPNGATEDLREFQQMLAGESNSQRDALTGDTSCAHARQASSASP